MSAGSPASSSLSRAGYLVYYWARIRFGNNLTLADDPIVGFAARYSGQLETFARRHGTPLISTAGAIVALALTTGLVRWLRRRPTPSGEPVR